MAYRQEDGEPKRVYRIQFEVSRVYFAAPVPSSWLTSLVYRRLFALRQSVSFTIDSGRFVVSAGPARLPVEMGTCILQRVEKRKVVDREAESS